MIGGALSKYKCTNIREIGNKLKKNAFVNASFEQTKLGNQKFIGQIQ